MSEPLNAIPAVPAAPATAAAPRARRRLLPAMGLLLLLVFGAMGVLQMRQLELLNTTRQYQDDYLVWSLFQYEAEYLKLRTQLGEALRRGGPEQAQQAAQRYEIFVSRLGLIEGEHAAKVLTSHPDYRRTLERSRAFVAWADTLPLDAALLERQPERVRELLERLAPLGDGIHDLSLTASHHVAAQLSARNELVRSQSTLSLGLTLLQCALLLGLAIVVMRQLRSLERHGRDQETLAEHLREARQAAEAGSRAKSLFLANMSHELRTPLHGLLGMLGLLKDTPLRADQRLQLQAASDSARHLLAILNDILDVSKMEAGAITIHPEPVQPARLLRELDEICQPQARLKGVALSLAQTGEVPAWVSADPTRLRQILLNLLSNAIKFTDQGRVDLRLSHEGQVLRFSVNDTGTGMDEALLGRLFQRFSQGDATSSRRHGGTGLGLEISRNLARAMGGDIQVHSTPGLGSTFVVELPLPACEAPAQLPDTSGAALPPTRSLRILVAEDHVTNRHYLEAVLERLGHHAVFCENGFEALQRLSLQDFDLVLMDLHMPVMDGYEACRAMRALPGAKARVPIVALSADAFEESRERALQAGMADFLAKPVEIETLAALLHRQSLPPAPAPAAPPPAGDFDDEVLQVLRRTLPPARVPGLYQTFVQDVPVSLQRLDRALQPPDAEALRSAAHAVKGASASLGLTEVARAARELERLAKQGADATTLSRCGELLRHALQRSPALCAQRGLI
ncbi:response regulator [Roseateles sp. DAIF2]|uniref:ATP-binding protein n=1 Tax=Roseateles sp. DAIF2 TaxID=2714952 RepID=UPI0018A329BC|nr:ATP-binding protein [Roseateles sp. DAIF2]QPF73544.1 response regulator [Roseateles sp. DAIF2]